MYTLRYIKIIQSTIWFTDSTGKPEPEPTEHGTAEPEPEQTGTENGANGGNMTTPNRGTGVSTTPVLFWVLLLTSNLMTLVLCFL